MDTEYLNEQIKNDLKHHLSNFTENAPSDFIEVFNYGLFPTGKLFRANLIWRYFCDLNQIELNKVKTSDFPNIQLLCSSIELHHAYTLMHDDLPCMDDDNFRRGKPSVHKNFNEWKALLAGDGLLSLSYELLSHIHHKNTLEVIQKITRLCGPQGLIKGQFLDLSLNPDISTLNDIIEIHHLKTANLFECCLIGTFLLTESDTLELSSKEISKMGKGLGITFQLLDDLTELIEKSLGEHEVKINPWLNNFEQTFQLLNTYINETQNQLANHQNLNELVSNYLNKIKDILEKNLEQIEVHLKNKELGPVISLF